MMPGCNTEEENALVRRARALMATYEDMADMIRLGAYRRGSDPQVDESIKYHDALEAFLSQDKDDQAELNDGRSEEQTSALQSPMRTSYAVFCLKKKTQQKDIHT